MTEFGYPVKDVFTPINSGHEKVMANHRGNCDQKTRNRGDEGLGDSGRNSIDACVPLPAYIDKRIHNKTKLPVHVAEDPLRAVARGTGIALKNFDKFPFLIK